MSGKEREGKRLFPRTFWKERAEMFFANGMKKKDAEAACETELKANIGDDQRTCDHFDPHGKSEEV